MLNSTQQNTQQKLVTILKVEAVKVRALHQVAQRLRLKGREAGVTYLPERANRAATLEPREDVF